MYKLYLNGWKWINKDVFSRIWKTRMWKLVGLFDIFTYLRDLQLAGHVSSILREIFEDNLTLISRDLCLKWWS